MRALIQRVSRARAADQTAKNQSIAAIEKGMLILVGFEASDSPVSIEQLAQKIKGLRIFTDEKGKMNISGSEISAEVLVVSQFTLYANCKYGNRPSFDKAAPKSRAKEYYEHFVGVMSRLIGPNLIQHTPFGSDLSIELVNDGPVTILLDSNEIL